MVKAEPVILVVRRPLPKSKLPENELEPVVKDEVKTPAVAKLPAVILFVAVKERAMLTLPAKELEPTVVVWKIKPPVVRLPAEWMPPVVVFKEPTKELEATVFWVMAPEMEAVPRSSNNVETEAKFDCIKPKPVALFELPESNPPKVKALICKVPVEEIVFVPPPVKVRPPPESVLRKLPPVVRLPAEWMPRPVFKEPEKELLPTPVERI